MSFLVLFLKSIIIIATESHSVAHADPKLLTSNDPPAPDSHVAGTVCISPYLTSASGFWLNF